MFAAALVKMVILPVIGVFIVEAMTKRGMMSREARAERFVGMFLSGTPAGIK
jgi:auxin efflux carrier family protein